MITNSQYQRAKSIIKKYENAHSADLIRIIEVTAKKFGHTPEEIIIKSRKKSICEPRHIVMFLSIKHLHQKLNHTGSLMGRFDHSTVLYAVRKIESLYCFDKDFKRTLDQIGSELSINIKELIINANRN